MAIYGLFTASDAKLYERSLGINVNLWWGLVLLVFGLAMLGLAWLAHQRSKGGGDSP